MKAKHQKIKSIFLILILFLITTSPILLSALQKNFAIRVACVGDSITYGAKIEDNFLNSYPAQLQLFLGSDYLVGNFGASGYTLQKAEISLIGITLLFRKALLFSQISC